MCFLGRNDTCRHISTCALSISYPFPFLFMYLFNAYKTRSVYRIFPFCTDTLLLISYSHFPLYLLIHNVGLDINVKILQLNWRHLGLLHMNAITSSAAIHPLFFILSPILCHSPLCLYLFPPPYKSPSRLYTVVI